MALRNIVQGGDPILRKTSRPITVFDGRLHTLLDDMTDTMRAANGAGLAAVQVGVLRRAVVIDVGEGLVELVNPVITRKSKETIVAGEGCLSFPREYGTVERPRSVTVEALDRNGDPVKITGENMMARALCHELDHLDGVVFKDLASEIAEVDEDDE